MLPRQCILAGYLNAMQQVLAFSNVQPTDHSTQLAMIVLLDLQLGFVSSSGGTDWILTCKVIGKLPHLVAFF